MKMVATKIFLFSIVIMLGTIVFGESGSEGVSVDAALGMPRATIANPDYSQAHYNGISLLGRLHVPLYENPNFGVDLLGSLKYLDYKNGANTATMQEYAQHIGAGPGLEIRVLRFIVGMESHLMVARQNTVGTFSNSLDYTFPTTTVYYGVTFPRNFLALSFTYSSTTGDVPRDKTRFNNDSPYNEHAYWIHIKYSTGFRLEDFWRALISR